MTENLTVEVNLAATMGGKQECTITIDLVDDTCIVACDGYAIFSADISAIADQIARLVYDGKTVKAYNAAGEVIGEYEIL